MDYGLKGKLAFVNAGAYGSGEAVADLLTQEGASVIVADRDEEALQEKAARWTGVVAADLATAAGTQACEARGAAARWAPLVSRISTSACIESPISSGFAAS